MLFRLVPPVNAVGPAVQYNGLDFLNAQAELNGWPFPADPYWFTRQENTNPNP